ncbi:MAG TPA: hypothetical protein PK004_06960 [Smithella sp.]|nr:hypothetical protein [Smithella sp.]
MQKFNMNIFNRPAIGTKQSPLTYRDQATLEIRNGGGCIAVFGFPFLLAGLFIMQIPLGMIPVNGSPGVPSSLFFLPFGAVFALVGALLVFGRSGIILDRARGRVIQWYGLLVPMKRNEYLLDSVDQVEMNFSPGDSDSPATWPITLSGRSIAKSLSIVQPASFAEARKVAEELSRFLRKPLMDSSTGEKIIRDFDHLNESYRDRIRRKSETINTLSPEPVHKRSRIEHTSEGMTITIAEPSPGWIHYLSALAPLVFAGMVIWLFLPRADIHSMPVIFRYFFPVFIGFFMAVPVLVILGKKAGMKTPFEVITVTETNLRVEALRHGKQTTVEIPVSELEDLVAPSRQEIMDAVTYPGMKNISLGRTGTARMPDGRPMLRFLLALMKMAGSRGIIARSDNVEVEFARGLDDAEVAWLFALIKKTIIG